MSIENTTDTTDSSNAKGDGSTEQNSTNTLEAKNEAVEAVDEAIDEAIKTETEKLYEEACSIVSSGTFLHGSY